jgi:hypothetical protein
MPPEEDERPGSATEICYACRYRYSSVKEYRWWVSIYQICLCVKCYPIWLYSQPKSPLVMRAECKYPS